MEEEEKIDHIIRVGKKDVAKYIYALLIALQPHNYEKIGNLKIQATEKNLPAANHIVELFKNLWIEEISRIKKKITVMKEDGSSYPLEIIEITIQKHPKLRR